MVISKEPLHIKLEIDGRMVEQVMQFNYLGVNITSSGNLLKESKAQAARVAAVGMILCKTQRPIETQLQVKSRTEWM